MGIPLSYNLRNLIARKTTTIMTALGIGLTVAVLLSVMAMVEGLRTSLVATADPLNVLVMRQSSTAELVSILVRTTFQDVKAAPGIARGANGEPLASLELVTLIMLENPEFPAGVNISLRGITPVGIAIRDKFRIKEGRWFETGKREVVVGESVARRYPGARIGAKFEFRRGQWVVVGILDAGRSAAGGEVFADLNQLAADQGRPDALSSALLRAQDEAAVPALINTLNNDRRLNVTAQTEKSYYEAQTNSGTPLQMVGTLIAVIMAVGSIFAGMNTMYAAVARRSAEIGTLRVLGFSRFGILSSFFIESLLLSAAGGIIGCLLVLPLNDYSTGIGSLATFSEITFQFRVTPQIMAAGLLFALLMGTFGGLFPASSAARKEILTALRSV